MSLPPDLSRLGDDLEHAAGREVTRRRRIWAARTATLGAVFACLSAGLAPDSVGPGLRTVSSAQALIATAELPRCVDARPMRRGPCGDAPPLLTDAASGRESDTIVQLLGDAAQSKRTGPSGRRVGNRLTY
jgi:hypothetical protein